MSGVRELLGKPNDVARASSLPASSLPAPPRMPNIPVAAPLTAKSEPPLPLKVRRAPPALPAPNDHVPPLSANTTAFRIEEIRSIAEEVANRESDAKRAARLHAVALRVERSSADESKLVLRRMFPHLVRQSPMTIAVRVVFFVGYVAVALWSVALRTVRQIPRLAVQARNGLRDAWMRAAFRDSEKPRC